MRFLRFRWTRTLENREVVLNDIAVNKRATPKMQEELGRIKWLLNKRYNKKKTWINLK